MKNKMVMIFTMGIIAMLMTPYSLLAVHANVAVRVLNENNTPIYQADVEIGFKTLRAKALGKGWGTEGEYHPAKGKTDADGMYSASDNTSPNVVVTVTKPGYYESNESFFSEKTGVPHEGILTIILKKVNNPVPMYAKKVNSAWTPSKVPVLNQDVGYDLESGDWIAPHGKGKTADLVFNITAENKDLKKDRKCVYSIKFSNDKDGIQEYNADKENQSAYRWPYEAPEDGYVSKLEKYDIVTSDRREKNIKNDNEVNYIYRVRTKTDEKGNIMEAKYGKIQGEITVFSNGGIQFTYCFNPSGSRSLEFDTEKNLFIPGGAKKWKEPYYNFTGFAQ